MQQPVRTGLALFLGFLCLWPLSALAGGRALDQAGYLVAASGVLSARNEMGEERNLDRRDPVYSGDTVVVGENGFAQIRFTDGGQITLRPSSEFKIDEYHFQGKEDSAAKAFFRLLKGGLRAISGAVGKEREESYRMVTPVATVGIRGTHYGLRYCDAEAQAAECGPEVERGLYGGVMEGAVVVGNEAGEQVFQGGRYFHVAALDLLPKLLMRPPNFIFDGLESGKGLREPGDDGRSPGEPGPSEERGESRGPEGEQFSGEPPGEGGPEGEGGPLSPSSSGGEPGDLSPQGEGAGGPAGDFGGLESAGGGAPSESVQGTQDFGAELGGEPVFQTSDTRPASGVTLAQGAAIAFATQATQANGDTEWIADLQTQGEAVDAVLGVVNGRDGVLTELVSRGDGSCAPRCTFTSGAATLAQQGGFAESGKPRIQWGRWDGEWSGSDKFGAVDPQTSWHYVYSPDLTSQADLSALQAGNVIGYFNPLAGTSPTDELGNVGSFGQSSPYMVVDFGQSQVVRFDVEADFSQTTGRSFVGTLATPQGFSSAKAGGMALDVTCAGCADALGSGQANVTFVGGMASHAIGSFEMHTLSGGNTAAGAFVLEQGASSAQ